MFDFDDSTTVIVGATELRTDLPAVFAKLNNKKVVIMKRGKPVAVFQDYKDYESQQNLIENLEDLVLGSIAKERNKKSKPSDYISHEEMLKLI